MAVEVALGTPLAEALSAKVQGKLSENGWITGGVDDTALGEYVILMLVNGKTQDQIATELSTDLLNLPPEDRAAAEFAGWLFEQTELLNKQLNQPLPDQSQQTQIPPFQPSVDNGTAIRGAATRSSGFGSSGDAAMNDAMDGVQDGNVPKGPKSMRNGPRLPGNKRMMGQLSKALDRSGDGALHRIQGNQNASRVNTHNRQQGRGPRTDQSRPYRQPNGRSNMGPNGAFGNGNMNGPLLQMSPQQQMQLMAMLEQQAQMMAQIMPPQQQQQMLMQGMGPDSIANFQNNGQASAKSLFDRVEGNPKHLHGGPTQRKYNPNNSHGGQQKIGDQKTTENVEGSTQMEVDKSQPNESSANSVCKFNLHCTKKDCAFAHQSPAAPPGTTIDVNDECPFGAACKNKKCVGRHPSPYQKVAHASEQDCKFFPHCTNPSCPFRHPSMPMCKFGANCNREGCQFTHVNIVCKYNPCLNPECPYKHAEGQMRGKYGDKVWTADQSKEHVSERKFVDDEMGEEELIKPDGHEGEALADQHPSPEVVT